MEYITLIASKSDNILSAADNSSLRELFYGIVLIAINKNDS